MTRTIGRVIFSMGLIFVIVALPIAAIVAGGIYFPDSPLGAVLDWARETLTGASPGQYAAFEPDELVYDNLLGADVPRAYYLSIPRLGLLAPVVAVGSNQVHQDGLTLNQLHVPHAYAVGWSDRSAPIGAHDNTVFVGHNNIYGEVFKDLWNLQAGDEIVVQTAGGDRSYRVEQVISFEERDLALADRLENAHWIQPTGHEQLTLVTCWPYYSNTHRLVVIALPVG